MLWLAGDVGRGGSAERLQRLAGQKRIDFRRSLEFGRGTRSA